MSDASDPGVDPNPIAGLVDPAAVGGGNAPVLANSQAATVAMPESTLGFANPMQAFAAGQSTMNGLNSVQTASQQNALRLDAAKKQEAAAKATQAAANERQSRIISLARKLGSGESYPGRAADMLEYATLVDPKTYESAKAAWAQMTDEQQKSALKMGGTVGAYLADGDLQGAQNYVDQQKQLAQDSGDTQSLAGLNAVRQILSTTKDPKAARSQIEHILVTIPGGDKVVEGFNKITQQPHEEAKIDAQTANEKAQATEHSTNAADTANLSDSKKAELKARAYDEWTHGDLNTRLPVEGKDGKTTTDSADSTEIDAAQGVLDAFAKNAKNGAAPATGAWGQLTALGGDLMGPDIGGPAVAWRNGAKQVLQNTILNKLKALRPASDTDVKFIQSALDDAGDPTKMLNAIWVGQQALKYEQERNNIIAYNKANPSKPQALPTKPKMNYTADGSPSGLPYFVKDGKYYFAGKEVGQEYAERTGASKTSTASTAPLAPVTISDGVRLVPKKKG